MWCWVTAVKRTGLVHFRAFRFFWEFSKYQHLWSWKSEHWEVAVEAPNLCSGEICTGNFYQTIPVPYWCHLRICMNKMRPSAWKWCSLLMHFLLFIRSTCVYILYVLGSRLGALEVRVSVTASDMQSGVLQTSCRSHRENTRSGRWGPVATIRPPR